MGGASDLSHKLDSETQAPKKRKVVEKTVVRVKIGAKASVGKLKNEGLPSDFWSWRKYGQKPIKGSPYPRGYYRCSTSKGCSAKKQVERCKTDASVLIITYTSSHNHTTTTNPKSSTTSEQQQPINNSDQNGPKTPKQDQLLVDDHDHDHDEEEAQGVEEEEEEKVQQNKSQPSMNMIMSNECDDDYKFHYLKSPIGCPQEEVEEDPFGSGKAHLLGEEPISCSHQQLLISTTSPSTTETKSEGNEFFDELEELLPISSSFSTFTSFVKMSNSISFDERIPVVPFLN